MVFASEALQAVFVPPRVDHKSLVIQLTVDQDFDRIVIDRWRISAAYQQIWPDPKFGTWNIGRRYRAVRIDNEDDTLVALL